MQDFKKIISWQRAYSFSLKIYNSTLSFPSEEKFGLTSQLRRAAISIPINISEGAGRNSNKEFANFVQIAIGSASEVECELLIAKDLGYLDEINHKNLEDELIEIRRMMFAFRESLLKSSTSTEN